jgi:hypothetical protein
MPPKTQQTKVVQDVKRLTDYVSTGGVQLEGEKIKFETILGEDVKLLDFATLPSKMAEPDPETGKVPNYLILQVEHNGKQCVTSTGAKQVVEAIEQMPKQYLPVMIKVYKATNPNTKRVFYAVE